MFTIEYCKNGAGVADVEALEYAETWVAQPSNIKISNMIFIDAVRLQILREKFPHDNVQVKIGNDFYSFNKYGVCNLPEDYHMRIIEQILRETVTRKKKER